MCFSSTPIIGLKSTLRHSWKFSRKKKTVRLAVTGPYVKKGGNTRVRLRRRTRAERLCLSGGQPFVF